jgi:protein-S-isoprenylcysteine O-methyltransferase Ste14
MSRLPALGPRGEGWVVIQFLLLALVVLAGVAGPTCTGPLSTVARVAGVALVLAGLILATRGLLDTGSYALVRHPIYGGLVLAAAGYALVVSSPLALAGAAVLLVFFRLKSGREEAWLRERYPAYEAYAGRTKRMIPGIY